MSDNGDITLMKKHRKQCDYGEKCYRKNPDHFHQYDHLHLNKLLLTLGKDLNTLPADFKPKISITTIKEQLKIVRDLNPALSSCSTSAQLGNTSDKVKTNSSQDTKTSTGKKREYFGENNKFESPIAKRFHTDTAQGSSSCSGTVVSKQPKETNMESSLSSEEHRKKMQSARNMSEAMSFMQEVKKRSQGNILDKHKAAAPYYFFLTSVTDSKKTHTEPLSLQLFDILDPALGDLESSLQINFMVEFGWLMAQYLVAKQGGKPLTLLYGEMDVDKLSYPHITSVQVKPPSPFGSHHTKMCVLSYRDGSVRVCVHTANLVESDWDNRVQGVWLSPACPALSPDADSTAGESPTHFKHDLLQYLSAYRLAELQPWLAKLRKADFSQINVCFVGSVPGSHKGVDSDRWGHSRLASLLKKHVQITPRTGSPPSSWQVIAQCSSIGSLGPQPTAWFCGEIKQAMSGGLGMALQSPPPIRLVYPSFDNVASSHDGLLGGGCLPYSQRVHEKQPWLLQYLYQWKSDSRHRTRAVPHIKTYTRVSPDLTQAAWFHLTSANLSKAAWGSLTKAGALSILSYEAGVLFLPQFVLGTNSFPIKKEAAGDQPVLPLPYDLPLTQYGPRDVPWFMDNLSGV